MKPQLHCPSCGALLEGSPLRCRCGWHLITLEAWRQLPAFRQGFALYSQGSWPTSEIARQTNPYAAGTREHAAFREGELRATLAAQDGEE